MKIIDTFLYNGEPIVELRLALLSPWVDEFILIESHFTYSGDKKPFLYFHKYANIFQRYLNKIKFIAIDNIPPIPGTWLQTTRMPWMKRPEDWWRENYQRDVAVEYIQDKYKDSPFLLLCSDVDEIVRPRVLQSAAATIYEQASKQPLFIEMDFYYYNFDWLKKYKWYQGFFVTDKTYCLAPLSYIRCNISKDVVLQQGGWHCSYFLSQADLQRKITSFAHQEYNQPQYKTKEHICYCLMTGKDIFVRGDHEDLLPQSDYAARPPGWEQVQYNIQQLQAPDTTYQASLPQTQTQKGVFYDFNISE